MYDAGCAGKIIAVCPHDKTVTSHRLVIENDGIVAYCEKCKRPWTAKDIGVSMYLGDRQDIVAKNG